MLNPHLTDNDTFNVVLKYVDLKNYYFSLLLEETWGINALINRHLSAKVSQDPRDVKKFPPPFHFYTEKLFDKAVQKFHWIFLVLLIKFSEIFKQIQQFLCKKIKWQRKFLNLAWRLRYFGRKVTK